MTMSVGWTLPKAPPLPQAGSAPSESSQTLTPERFASEPPEIQARLLAAISSHYAPDEYVPYLESLVKRPNTAAWPKFVASCLSPSPCSELSRTKDSLYTITINGEPNELNPEPLFGISYKPPEPGYNAKPKPQTPQRRASSSAAPSAPAPLVAARRSSATNELLRLGTGMQPTLSRKRSNAAKTSLPRVRSLFLSGRKSEKARAAEEKAREEREKAEREKAQQQAEAEASAAANADANGQSVDANGENADTNGGNGDGEEGEIQGNDLVEARNGSDMDITVEDAAEIEVTEGMDEDMIQSQRDKEARPRHVGEIVRKMHGSSAGHRNIVAEDTDLPAPTDTGYARLLRREEAAKKRQEQANAAREKERQMMKQRRLRFEQKRKRKLRKAGRTVLSDSEEDQTSVAAEDDPTTPENASNLTHNADTFNRDPYARDAQRRRFDQPDRYEDRRQPDDDRYRGQPQDGGGRYDDPRRYNFPPPPDSRRYGNRPSQWQPPSYPFHPSSTPSTFGPPPAYYAPPSPYYGYHPPPPYYSHHSPPPPHQQYYPLRAPPRLSREDFEKRRKELFDKVGNTCDDLHPDDLRAIEDFLDNQDHMFRPKEKMKYIVLEQSPTEEVLLRIDKETRAWEVVRKRVSS